MKCPICNDVRMREVEKDGVHIDICPECKGVWLDRGELDKLMQGVREVRREYDEWEHQVQRNQSYSRDGYPKDHEKDKYKYGKYKKKRSVFDVFEDLF